VTTSPIPLPRPGAHLRACAALATLLVPLRTRAEWQWYRRARGGQWSRLIHGRWRPVKACPGAMWSDILGGEPVPAGLCFDDPITGEKECHCEVWT